MGLKEYHRKRDFKKTPEPAGNGKKKAAASGLLFVVQKHDASRLHYDFRLELDGVLLSWAVPKGPSYDPADKRLAVHVEDHPIDYGEFEGIIPQGQYGGGTVMLWDMGTWEPVGDPQEGMKKGNLKFILHGQKLIGKWALIQMHVRGDDEGKNWFLMKEKDEFADKKLGGKVVEAFANSVKTGRTLEEIEASQDKVWQSNRKENSGDKDLKTTIKRAAQSAKKKTAVKEARSAREAKSKPAGKTAEIPGARKAAMPDFLEPQLATLVEKAPEGENWIHELKFDGYRLLAHFDGKKIRLMTRRGLDWTSKFKELLPDLQALALKTAVLDGEVVALRPNGTSDFQTLQGAIKRENRANLYYYLFDVPYLKGMDLRGVTQLRRKEILKELLKENNEKTSRVRYSDHLIGNGAEFFEQASRKGLEGIVSKRIDAPYSGRRTRDWLKVRAKKGQEMVIGGYSKPSGSRTGFGALLLGYYESDDFIYAGRVGTGFNEESLKSLLTKMKPLARTKPAFKNPPRGADARNVTWLEPELVADIKFSEWTSDGSLRHPVFYGLRKDKKARDVKREVEEPVVEVDEKKQPVKPTKTRAVKVAAAKATAPIKTKKGKEQAIVGGVTITSPDRILYPEQGVTKLELAQYYDSVADLILPYISGRAVSLVRCPQGRTGECFYQKHLRETLSAPVKGVTIDEEKGKAEYIMVDDKPGLISLVQFNAMELHPWGSHQDDLEHPDWMIFDFDPDPGAGWAKVVDGVRRIKEILDELGLKSFLKTTGGKGLHVVVPLSRRNTWEEVKESARLLALEIVKQSPEDFLAKASKESRKNKVYVDYLRNGRGATAIAPFSTRARPGATVAVPLAWEELDGLKRADEWNIEDLGKRLAKLKNDPWGDFFKTKQSLTKAILKEIGYLNR